MTTNNIKPSPFFMEYKYDVYLSGNYESRVNIEFNEKVCAALKNAGLQVFFPARDFPEYDWKEGKFKKELATEPFSKMLEAIDDSRVFVCWDDTKSASGVWTEFGYAIAKMKPTIYLWTNPWHDFEPWGFDLKFIAVVNNVEELIKMCKWCMGRLEWWER